MLSRHAKVLTGKMLLQMTSSKLSKLEMRLQAKSRLKQKMLKK